MNTDNRRTHHPRLRPLQLDRQHPTGQLHPHRSLHIPVLDRRVSRSRGARSRRQRLADAALPDTHPDTRHARHRDELDVGAVREVIVRLDPGADDGDVDIVGVVREHHGVRVADRHRMDTDAGDLHRRSRQVRGTDQRSHLPVVADLRR